VCLAGDFAVSKKACGKEEPQPATAPSQGVATADQGQLMCAELERLQARLQLLAARAAATYDDVVAAGADTAARLADLAAQQHQGECSAVAALEAYFKRMAYEGQQASTGISLAGTVLGLGLQAAAGQQQQGLEQAQCADKQAQQESTAAAGAWVPAGGLTAQQLLLLAEVFQDLAPDGLAACSCVDDVLGRSAAEGGLQLGA
jgi:hypothetical protein